LATITITKALIGAEDVQFETADTGTETFSRTTAGGGTQNITKLGARHIPLEDSGSILTGTNVESALQEIKTLADLNAEVFSGAQGADIAVGISATIPSNHFYFDVTGTGTFGPTILHTPTMSLGKIIILRFDNGGVIVANNRGGLELADDRNFTTFPGQMLALIYLGDGAGSDGYIWRELFRTTAKSDPVHEGLVDVYDQQLGNVKALPGSLHFTYNSPLLLNGFVGGSDNY